MIGSDSTKAAMSQLYLRRGKEHSELPNGDKKKIHRRIKINMQRKMLYDVYVCVCVCVLCTAIVDTCSLSF